MSYLTMLGISVISSALGIFLGVKLSEWIDRRKSRKEAPVPDYDIANPINGRGHRGEIVEICGKQFMRMN